MNRILNINKKIIFFIIPLMLLGILIIFIKSPFFTEKDDTLNIAITIDLLLTVPFVYFLLIRKSKIQKTTVVLIMVIGTGIGSYLLPVENQIYLSIFKIWVFPVIEIIILAFIIIKVRKAIKTYSKLKSKSLDFYDSIKLVSLEIFPKKLVILFTIEIAVFYYGFINWKTKQLNPNEYTYHKNSGTPSLLGGFIMIITIETIALHFLLSQWNIIIAWCLTGLSIYTAIQVLGFMKSLTKRPIIITENVLLLRYGIMNESQIPIPDIESIVLSKDKLEKNKLTKTLSPLGELESHNIIINLKRKNTLLGIYGNKNNFTTIALHIDKPNDFKNKIENALQKVF